jgi:hypothetical protein
MAGVLAATFAQPLDPQLYRTYSGEFNNPVNPSWGQAGTDLIRLPSVGFADGYQALAGPNRPNPRRVSNEIFAQEGLLNDPLALSDFTWVFGQFIDHDIGLTPDGPEPLIIQVPAGDAFFDPMGLGQAIIPMHRNIFNPATGTGPDNPRQYPNIITAFIDGSGVYGSDEERANWLRTFEGGKLKVSAGNLLPFNTVTGEFNAPIDPDAPHMDNPTGISAVIAVAGDPRASENPLLFAFHTLFVREHNRQCDLLAAQYPEWTDEQLYQHARKIVGGFIQSIVYDEWLPAMGVELPEYSGFDPTVNPQLLNIFTAAAFRMGHTLLNGTLRRLDNEGNIMPQGHLALSDAFFNPYAITEVGGIEPYLKGMATQVQQSFDSKVIDDVRNRLFGQPGFGGLDLAAININRGRERGLPDFNSIRADLGLQPYFFFQQINSNPNVYLRLLTLYNSVNSLDAWVGMLAETPVPGALFGETVLHIMTRQFQALRDGDRFYYLNDPVLSDAEKELIHRTTLRDIIMYNTDILLMQDDVFGALPHEEICAHMTLSLFGLVHTEDGEPISQVEVSLYSSTYENHQLTSSDGVYQFMEMPFCDLETLIPYRDDNPLNGVSTFDIVLIQKHILAIQPLDSPYKIIAADIDNSGSVTTLDIVRLRKVILGIDQTFDGNTSWRFVWSGYEFSDPDNPLQENFPEMLDFSVENPVNYALGFIGIKVGDVNGSASLDNLLDPAEERGAVETGLFLTFADQAVQTGDLFTVDLEAQALTSLVGFQCELELTGLSLVGVESTLGEEYWARADAGLRFSWNENSGLLDKATLARLTLRAEAAGKLSEMLSLGRSLSAESYDWLDQQWNVQMQAGSRQDEFLVGQNQPNPFREETMIPFVVSNDGWVNLSVIDLAGRVVYQRQSWTAAGQQQWLLHRDDLPGAGVYTYRLMAGDQMVSKRMIVQ